MNGQTFSYGRLNRVDAYMTRWLTQHSVSLLRASLGLVFLGFGVLKFFPGVSPAEDIAKQVMDDLTLGLIPGSVGLVLVALMESAIGLSLLTGRYLRFGLALLGVAMVGVLSPLVLFPDRLFAGEYNAPTLEGQYVVKDVVLLAAGLVVALKERGANLVLSPEQVAGDAVSDDHAGHAGMN